jgi:hypothetical protein
VRDLLVTHPCKTDFQKPIFHLKNRFSRFGFQEPIFMRKKIGFHEHSFEQSFPAKILIIKLATVATVMHCTGKRLTFMIRE